MLALSTTHGKLGRALYKKLKYIQIEKSQLIVRLRGQERRSKSLSFFFGAGCAVFHAVTVYDCGKKLFLKISAGVFHAGNQCNY